MSVQFSIEHLGLAAQDTPRLKEWYESVFGARVLHTSAHLPPTYFIELPGGLRIEIYQGSYGAKETSDNQLQGWRHLAISVASIDLAKTDLEKKGVRFTEAVKPASGGGRVLFFRDPEGNLLHLIERPEDSIFHR